MYTIEVINNETNEVVKRCVSLAEYTDYALTEQLNSIVKAIEETDTNGGYTININKREEGIESMDSNVKEWYTKEFESDELGEEINPTITFKEIYDNMLDIDFYELIDVGDSIIRERIFEKMSNLMNIDYDDIYHRWLDSYKG